MGLPGLIKDFWLKTLGGQNPTGAASASGDIGQMIKYLAAGYNKSWTPFGLAHPYYGGGVDTVISAPGTIANQFQQYRDLTINSGIVLTAGFSPQIIVCRNLIFGNTAAQISANGLGGAGGAWADGAGKGGITSVSITTPGSAAAYESVLEVLMAAGGGGAASVAGASAGARARALAISLGFLSMGIIGGGGGGNVHTGGTGAGAGGVRGGAAEATGGKLSYGGGSGFGGGGSANNVNGAADGGAGGGVLIVLCDDIQTAAGIISANGLAGAVTGSSGGGGGGGGLVLVHARTTTVTPTLQANGGAGAGSPVAGAGGAGIAQLVRSV